MIDEVNVLVENYFKWLKDKTVLKRKENNWYTITTPYLDRHNDCLQIYVKVINDEILISDDGYTVSDLEMSGCDLTKGKRRALLESILLSFGIRNESGVLSVTASHQSFAQKKHNFLQAILAINDLFYLTPSLVNSVFYEDIARWMEISNIRHSQNVRFEGKSGFSHNFDFLIPHYKEAPERIVQTVNNVNKSTVESILFKWTDTKDAREKTGVKSNLYVILNDLEKPVLTRDVEAFKSYGIIACPWSKRDFYKAELAA